jgi:sialate O-acetylesterase
MPCPIHSQPAPFAEARPKDDGGRTPAKGTGGLDRQRNKLSTSIMKILSLILLAFAPGCLFAELSTPHFFSDHMVLQRDRPAAIWGRAEPNAEVRISFKGKSAATRSDAKGKWRTTIETGSADAKGETLTISAGQNTMEINDVLVGEVWFASGQSNMGFPMRQVADLYKNVIQESSHPGIRMFNAPRVTAVDAQEDSEGAWAVTSPQTVPDFSAVAFFFARKLHLELGIPIGVINTSWGAKPIETFTSREALNTLPATKVMVDAALKADAAYDPEKALANYEKNLANWKKSSAKANINAVQTPDTKNRDGASRQKPTVAKRALETEGQPGVLFQSMIHPFIGYTMRGAIWYQGEANTKPASVPYDQTLPLMIKDWRERWNEPFSFYYVQLANFRMPSNAPGVPDFWPLLQDRMRLVLDTTPKTGMVVINDVGDAENIHPINKKDPGERLALWALAKDYGKDIIYSGPLYQTNTISNDSIRITFNHAGNGLKSRDGGPLKRFEIAGSDKVWHWADAKIEGKDSVLVSSPQVHNPVAVRYAWARNPEGANLINNVGLPASVFRTDDWIDPAPK